jgi:hypothetical protein
MKHPLPGNDSEISNMPEPLLGNAFTNKTRSHGNNLSNNTRAPFSVGPSRDVITETHLEVSSVVKKLPFREELSMETEE